MRISRKAAALLASATLALGVAACGDDEGSGGGAAAEAARTTS